MPQEIILEGDAFVTKEKNIIITVVTADCVPILAYSDDIIAIAHAGWKGALYGVIDNMLSIMCQQGAICQNIRLAIGPAIAQQSYEVNHQFYQEFCDNDKDNQQYFINSSDKPHHYYFDLKNYCYMRARQFGVDDIWQSHHDTYIQEDMFYSYRRATHRQENYYGRQITAIMLSS